jgi:hypothetical protein
MAQLAAAAVSIAAGILFTGFSRAARVLNSTLGQARKALAPAELRKCPMSTDALSETNQCQAA